jgi:hypothetical protein
MEVMFGWIIGGWAVGMTSYIILSKKKKYNNLTYYNVKDKVKKFKRVKEDVNTSSKTMFK